MSTHRVTIGQMRKIFNDSGYYEREDILRTLKGPPTPANPANNQPPGTMSETWLYHEIREGKLVMVALLHQYVLSDGTINNRAKRPDPKYLRIGDEVYKLRRKSVV